MRVHRKIKNNYREVWQEWRTIQPFEDGDLAVRSCDDLNRNGIIGRQYAVFHDGRKKWPPVKIKSRYGP
jgi:hypothetical protein